MKKVWVECAPFPIRIFKTRKSVVDRSSDGDSHFIKLMDKAEAVKSIRHTLWIRCGGRCELCGDVVTEKTGHMHEQKHRGKGGEISLENSVFVCARTHDLEHGDRKPKFSKKLLTAPGNSGTLES